VFSLIHFLFFETLKNRRKTGNKQEKTDDLFFDTLVPPRRGKNGD